MILQIQEPAANDPYFNTIAAGGISTCILAANPCKGKNTLPNCVAGAWGFFNKAACYDGKTATAKYFSYPPNAGRKWLLRAEQAGLSYSKFPSVGAIAVWGNPNDLDTGHVAGVYRVDNDGTIYTAESEWGGRVWVNRTYNPPYKYGNKVFLGFIHQPEIKNPVLKMGSRGADVKNLQSLLISKGYMRKNECDGDFGRITKGAVCCFQLENGLTVDGICGAETWAKLR